MPIQKNSKGLSSSRGERDSQHHKDRVRKQISEHLNKEIGNEDIITGKGKVKIPVKGNKQYRFILDRNLKEGAAGGIPKEGGTEPGEELYEVWLDMDEVEEYLFQDLELPRLKPKKQTDAETADYKFDSYAVKGPQIDKKATLRRALARNAILGKEGLGIEKSDLRYITYREKPKPKSNAVIFCCMDVSGSMTDSHKRIARLFFFWVVKFLRTKYDNVDIRFISHTTEAKEVTEHQFFNRKEDGGTMVSSAYKLVQEIQARQYSVDDWNIYVLHASDGDNWQLDNEEVNKAIKDLCKVATLVGYVEIKKTPTSIAWGGWATASSTLSKHLQEHASELGPEFVATEIRGDKEIWEAVKRIFGKTEVEASVA